MNSPLQKSWGALVISFAALAVAAQWAVKTSALSAMTQSSNAREEKSRFISFQEAAPVLNSLAALLPEDLVHIVAAGDQARWDKYVRAKDAETRQRLRAGDMDTLANLLLFGASFTSAAVLTPDLLKQIHGAPVQANPIDAGSRALLQRFDDLTSGLAHPGTNERLNYFHNLLAGQYHFGTPQELLAVKQFLAANLLRMLREDESYAAALREAHNLQEAGFEKRSQVFSQRGISLDTALFPNYSLEQALIQARKQGVFHGQVTNVGVIGPGLDIVNKDEGLDYYPEQTIQPFLLADTLVRLGFADPDRLEVTTFDVSELVNHHLSTARERAVKGSGYIVQLPIRSDIAWTAEALAYWERAGSAIGRSTPALKSHAKVPLKYRAVKFAPRQVLHVHPLDLDVIYQRKLSPEREKMELIIATNMFVYYGSFEQALAMSNIASMLSKGGILLTNDALPNGPTLALRPAGSTDTSYSSRPHDGDRVLWYQLAK